eukprot:gene6189-6904_t
MSCTDSGISSVGSSLSGSSTDNCPTATGIEADYYHNNADEATTRKRQQHADMLISTCAAVKDVPHQVDSVTKQSSCEQDQQNFECPENSTLTPVSEIKTKEISPMGHIDETSAEKGSEIVEPVPRRPGRPKGAKNKNPKPKPPPKPKRPKGRPRKYPLTTRITRQTIATIEPISEKPPDDIFEGL